MDTVVPVLADEIHVSVGTHLPALAHETAVVRTVVPIFGSRSNYFCGHRSCCLVYEVATFVGTVVLVLVDQVANYVGTVVTASAHELLYFCEHKCSDLISQNNYFCGHS